MSTATLGDWEFSIDPTDVSWDFNVRTSSTATIGGKVLQVLGVDVNKIVVLGQFGKGGRLEQQEFANWLRQRATEQADTNNAVIRFRVPSKGWDFGVQIDSLTEQGAQKAISLDVTNFNPKFRLSLHVVDDLGNVMSIKEAAKASYIKNISEGFGWKKTAYNGPLTIEEVEQLLAPYGEYGLAEYFSSSD